MAGDDLTPSPVAAYVADLRGSLAGVRNAERVVAEVRDHLDDAIQHRLGRGLDLPTAVAEALSAFGPAAGVAAGFEQGGGVMPTTFTRWSGLFGMLAAVVFAVVMPVEAAARGQGTDGRDPLLVSAPVGLILLMVGLLGMVARTRGSFGRWRGATALVLVITPVVMVAFRLGWGPIGAVMAAMILGGLALVLHTVFRVGALPRPPTLLLAAAAVGLAALSPTDLEKQSAPYYIGFALLALGWLWLQHTLWCERPESHA